MKTVKELFKIAQTEEATLFPEFDSEWWTGIYNVETGEDIDILFTRYYSNYEFYSSLEDLFDEYTDHNALSDFKRAVYALFMKNDKKYTELYRIHTIPDDEAYALTNNYDMHETYSGTNQNAGTSITGQRTDVTIDNIGSQNSAGLNKVTGWNSGNENTRDSNEDAVGSRQDNHQFTKGQEQDTSRTQGTDSHTLRRYGNIGVMTVDDLLKKHKDFWLVWDFLQVIFDDICRDYLLIGR
ncbi:MAG: hypothetical protein J6T10_19235 [Methanobrevibacter sp.]|nr:hypothetical protein [Methanobrevibacter sp.]